MAPVSLKLLLERLSSLTEVFFCQELIDKTRLAGANWGQNACRYRAMSHSYFVPYLENHAQYTCLRIAEASAAEAKRCDRWVVDLQLGHWNATELLQRLALLLSIMTLPNGSTN